jgi:hypothetical protein
MHLLAVIRASMSSANSADRIDRWYRCMQTHTMGPHVRVHRRYLRPVKSFIHPHGSIDRPLRFMVMIHPHSSAELCSTQSQSIPSHVLLSRILASKW